MNIAASPPLTFCLLGEKITLLDLVADWHHDAWGHLRPLLGRKYSYELFKKRCNVDKLPVTVVAFLAQKPIGMVSLLEGEEGVLDKNIPILDNVYLAKELRGKGMSPPLLQQAEIAAVKMGFKKLCLYTIDPSINKFYINAGWLLIKESTYLDKPAFTFYKELSSS